MISNIEITEFFISTVKASNEIKEYCEQNFNKPLTQFIGVDIEKAPEKDEFPVLIYEPVIKQIGNAEEEFDYEFHLRLAIMGDKKPKVEGNVVRYDGIYHVEKLGNLICEAIRKAVSCKSNLDTYDINFYHDEINVFPLYSGAIILRFSVPHVIGDNQIIFKGE